MNQYENKQFSVGGTLQPSGEAASVAVRIVQVLQRINIWFWLLVILPSTLTGLYLFAIASDLYMSEARFLVRAPGERPISSALSSLMPSAAGGGSGSEDAFAVQSFITSRDAVRALEQGSDLRAVFGRPEADFVSRFPNLVSGSSFEALFRHYGRFVDVTIDNASGVTILQVKAYRPQDAQAIAQALLRYSEQLVNRMNARAEADAVQEAEEQVAVAEKGVAEIERQLTSYRLREQILDPKLSSSSMYTSLDTIMTAHMAAASQLAELEKNTPNSPSIPDLKTRVAALSNQLDIATKGISGNSNSVASKQGDYQRLSLTEEIAAKTLATATDALENARIEAQRKHLYIEHIAEPNLPDYALYPQRLWYFGLVVVSCLMIYGVMWLLVAGIREHAVA